MKPATIEQWYQRLFPRIQQRIHLSGVDLSVLIAIQQNEQGAARYCESCVADGQEAFVVAQRMLNQWGAVAYIAHRRVTSCASLTSSGHAKQTPVLVVKLWTREQHGVVTFPFDPASRRFLPGAFYSSASQ